MRLLLNRLSTAWLVLALIVAPIQATALPVVSLTGNDCPMMQDNQQSVHAAHDMSSHASADDAAPQCPDCLDRGCDDGHCAGNSCFSVHMQLSLPVSLLVFSDGPGLDPQPDYIDRPSSLTPPPLLRPPVV
jgi:hypothetical protein